MLDTERPCWLLQRKIEVVPLNIVVLSLLTLDFYLAFVMLFLAATSLAVRGSGSDVGMGEFWDKKKFY